MMYFCSQCPLICSSETEIVLHIKSVHGKYAHPCPLCGKLVAGSSILEDHMRRHINERSFKCRYCNKAYFSESYLKLQHEKQHLGEAEKTHGCSFCGMMFLSSSKRDRHQLTHTGKHKHLCDICGIKIRMDDRRRHERTHTGERRHECTECGAKFHESGNLHRHKKIHIRKARQPRTHCDNKRFHSRRGSIHTIEVNIAAKNKLWVVCIFCGKSCVTKSGLFAHIRVHTRECVNFCELCRKEVKTVQQKNNHIRRYHTLEKPYICQCCRTRFWTNAQLKKHSGMCFVETINF